MVEKEAVYNKHCSFTLSSLATESISKSVSTSTSSSQTSPEVPLKSMAILSERLEQYRQERRSRRSSSLQKCKERTTEHINQFIRIQVLFRNGQVLRLLVDRTKTIEYVARQIEAEYAIRYLIDANEQEFSESDLLGSIANNSSTISLMQITQLYDAGNLALPFSAFVGDLLAFDDSVTAVTTEEVTSETLDELGELEESEEIGHHVALTSEEQDTLHKNKIAVGSVFALIDINYTQKNKQDTTNAIPNSLVRSHTIKSSTLDDRLQSVLHNIISMQFFNEFCLQEYSVENSLFWIEAEIFKTIQDPTIRYTFAQYLYLTYIAGNKAPLTLNLSVDVCNDIPWPPPECPELTMFDEAQDHAYTMIKGHAYTRYEKGAIFEKFLEFKLSDRYTYIQGRVLWSYDTMFKNHSKFDEIAEIVNIMIDPTSEKAQKALDEFGNRKFPSISSMLFRQRVLGGIIGRYFPLVSPVIRGYFNATNRNAWADRQKLMQKEKKLTKFFGQRPTNEHMEQQRAYGHSLGEHSSSYNLDTSVSIQERRSSSTNEEDSSEFVSEVDRGALEEDSVTSEGRPTDLFKRKKAEKLAEFFGESRLPRRHMKKQNHANSATAEPGSEVVTDSGGEDSDPIYYTDQGASPPVLSNQNELSQMEKRALHRRARKLKTMLGETLDERTVSDHIAVPVTLNRTGLIGVADSSPTPHDRLSHSLLTAISKSGALSNDNSTDSEISDLSVDSAGNTADNNYLFLVDFADETLDTTRMLNKQRLDKLSQFLGHRINETDLIGAQPMTPKSPSMARPLTPAEKTQFKKKSGKLERLLGSTVPAQAIVSYSGLPGDHFASIEDLDARHSGESRNSYLLESLESSDWRLFSRDSQRRHSIITSRRGSNPTSGESHHAADADQGDFSVMHSTTKSAPQESSTEWHSRKTEESLDDETIKRAKQLRLNKLRKMLGTDAKVNRVIEKQFLELIEMTIDNSADKSERSSVTTEDLTKLKTMAQFKVDKINSLGMGFWAGWNTLLKATCDNWRKPFESSTYYLF
ncbi:hypothetical protein BSLG_007001 [Batrachochytrium salamandrivorans]|nr:hypothetical protein BSLG_007001 [Batrachochytrium salamandrivorans]